jgi:hypothetical protein
MTEEYQGPTPPESLLKSWEDRHFDDGENVDVLLIEAYQAGADMELEACEKYWMMHGISPEGVVRMRYTRRPPMSVEAQALRAVEQAASCGSITLDVAQLIKKAIGRSAQ